MKIPSSTPSFCQMESRGQQASNESLFHGRSREVEDGAVLLHIGSRSSIQWESSKVEDSATLLHIGSRSSACCTAYARVRRLPRELSSATAAGTSVVSEEMPKQASAIAAAVPHH
jgi:hypothetical protein